MSTRTIKISDELHHRLRIYAVTNRMPMQTLTENILHEGLRKREFPTINTKLVRCERRAWAKRNGLPVRATVERN